MSQQVAAQQGYPFALWAFWAYIIVAVARLGEIVPGLGRVPLAKIAIAACVFGIMANRRTMSNAPLLSMPIPRTGFALLLLAGVSVLFSAWISATVSYFFTSALIVAVGFFLTLKLCNRRDTLIATLFVLVLTALTQGFAAFISGSGRISAGESYDTNDLAYLLVTVLPLAIAFMMRSATVRKRLVWIGVCGFLLLIIMLTQSRGGFLGLVGVAGFLVFRPLAIASPERVRKRSLGLAGRLAVIALAGVVVWVALPSAAKNRLLTVFSLGSDYNTDATLETGRMQIWKRNVHATIKRPIGFGLNTFGVVDMRTGGKFKAAHNSLIQVLVELGFLGLFLLLRAYWLAWRTLGQARRDDPDAVIFCHALRASLIGNFISGFFLSQAYSSLLWTLFAVIALCGLQFTDAGVIAKQPAGRRRA